MPDSTTRLGLPFPLPDDDVDVPRDIEALARAIDPLGVVPVGCMMMWPGTNAPTSWLLCQGQQVSAATYPALAAVLGQTGGNVTLPDLRDTFPVGVGSGTALGARGGANSVALSIAQVPSHNHGGLTGARDRSQLHGHETSGNFHLMDVAGGMFTSPSGNVEGVRAVVPIGNADAPDHLHPISAQGGGGAHENRPPFLALNFIIRAA
jgi:microcystin-dependent protein